MRTDKSISVRSEFLFNQPMQVRSNRRLIEALDDFVQETGDDEVLGDLHRNAAGAEIKEFVFIDLAAGSAVGATDVVGQNFELGHRVRFGFIAYENVADF